MHSRPDDDARPLGSAPPSLEALDLSHRFGRREVLASVTLAVREGEVLGLLGENGAGKSTLIRCLAGLIRPTRGTVRLAGVPLNRFRADERARRIAFVAQTSVDAVPLTVAEVVALGRLPHRGWLRLGAGDDAAPVARALAQVDAAHLANRPFGELSGGERQRVTLARALAQEAPVLLLDEPTNHLDVRHQLAILDLVRRAGVTAVLALHDMNLAAAFCDRLAVLRGGRLIATGAPGAVLTAAFIRRAFDVQASIDAHPAHGGPRVSFHAPSPTTTPRARGAS